MSLEELRAENERLTTANARLSTHIVRMGDNLETQRRELLAIGWDAGFATGKSRAMRMMSDEPTLSTAVANPYRQPVPDFSGGVIVCKTRDDAA